MLQRKVCRKAPKSTTYTSLIGRIALIPAGNMPDIPEQRHKACRPGQEGLKRPVESSKDPKGLPCA